jgi:probable phosphoglycerate mutase
MDDGQAVRQYRFRPAPGACDLLLVRHGESRPAAPGEEFPLLDGQADPPLHTEGLREAEAVAVRLEREEVSAIWVSPLTRTRQTAAPLLARLGLEAVVEPDLREVHLGDWDGAEYRRRSRADDPLVVEARAREDWGVLPGAETMAELCVRVRRGVERIASTHPDQRVVAFVHGGVIGAALHLATGASPFTFVGAANASLNHLVVSPERWVLRRFNDTGHLDTDLDRPVEDLA